MSEPAKTLEDMVREVPPQYREQLRNYVLSLMARRSLEQPGKPQFTWAGALEGMRDQYSSVELQHRIASWRAGRE